MHLKTFLGLFNKYNILPVNASSTLLVFDMPLFIIELLEKWVDNKIEEYCIIFINMKMQKFVTRFIF